MAVGQRNFIRRKDESHRAQAAIIALSFIPSAPLRAPSRWDILTAFPGPIFLTTEYGTLEGQQEVDRRPPAWP